MISYKFDLTTTTGCNVSPNSHIDNREHMKYTRVATCHSECNFSKNADVQLKL